MEIKNLVLREIIQIIEGGNNWKDEKVGNKKFENFPKIYKKNNSERRRCIEELIKLEENNYIKVEWYTDKIEPLWLRFSLANKNSFYEMAGIIPKEQRIKKYIEWTQEKFRMSRKVWIQKYYKSMLDLLENGNIPIDLEKEYEAVYQTENKKLFDCFDELNRLDELTYKRIFSKRVFNNSKIFEKKYEKQIISRAKKGEEEGFYKETSDKDILRLMNLDDYSTTLSIKGALKVKLKDREIDYSIFEYGCDINTQMLKEMEFLTRQEIKRVITVENKANFISMPFERDTLIIFTHGYLSPLECRVLKKLEEILSKETKYYHTGDLDLGGIRIFRFIKNKVFPELEPMNMDVATYQKYLEYGEENETEKYWKDLQTQRSEPFEELVDVMMQERLIIEQEAFLIK